MTNTKEKIETGVLKNCIVALDASAGGFKAFQSFFVAFSTDTVVPIPSIALTADAFADERKKAEEVGVPARLVKPVEPELLYVIGADLLKKGIINSDVDLTPQP